MDLKAIFKVYRQDQMKLISYRYFLTRQQFQKAYHCSRRLFELIIVLSVSRNQDTSRLSNSPWHTVFRPTSFRRYFLNVFYICAYVFSFWSFFVIRIIFGAVCNSSLNCVFNFLTAKAMKIGLVSFGKSILWNSKVRKMEIRNSFVTKISNLENRIRRLGQLRCFKFHLFL